MESLLEKLSSVDVTPHPNNPNAEHPHYSLYKAKRAPSSQEERRRGILEARKVSRYDLLNHLRNIEENLEISDEETEDNGQGMNVDELKALYRKPRQYQDFVMLSEWLVDVPEDFSEKYLAAICPVGRRCLCVGHRGRTTIYAKNGKFIKQFPSLLPGGSRETIKFGTTMLDCIWSEINSTFYIIDMMFWYNHSYIECDTAFRFSWLKSRIEEFVEDVRQISRVNRFRFIPVPVFNCDKASLSSMFSDPILTDVALDGILFYHKDTHYTHGPSPLVCWLKAFMLPEILGVEVPPSFMNERPAHYKDISSHIVEYNEERKLIKMQRSPKKETMEVCPTSEKEESEKEEK